ncbi:hypothetical protein BGY98DRAFT_203848 [Russula aff. rugulosa BPL654]|nr:hypothetical protein BGY98DRAFT_203848 [Russula aff. rugulosa BPL654]
MRPGPGTGRRGSNEPISTHTRTSSRKSNSFNHIFKQLIYCIRDRFAIASVTSRPLSSQTPALQFYVATLSTTQVGIDSASSLNGVLFGACKSSTSWEQSQIECQRIVRYPGPQPVMEGRQLNLAREHHREQSQCARRAHFDDKRFTTLDVISHNVVNPERRCNTDKNTELHALLMLQYIPTRDR